MIDGVKIEDWDFIFTPDDPVCEIKLNNLIDLYFENAEITKYASFDIFDILEGYRDFSYLKTQLFYYNIYAICTNGSLSISWFCFNPIHIILFAFKSHSNSFSVWDCIYIFNNITGIINILT